MDNYFKMRNNKVFRSCCMKVTVCMNRIIYLRGMLKNQEESDHQQQRVNWPVD